MDAVRPGAAGPPDGPRLLVLRALGLGDLLTGVPALRALRRAYPEHRLILAAPADLAQAAAATDAVDTLLPTSAPGRAVPETLPWTGPPPDIAVDLHGNGPPSHRLLQQLRPRRLLAFAHPGTPDIDGPPWRPDEHERQRWCRLLGHYGIAADPGDFVLRRPAALSPAPGATVLHPGAGSPARRWPADRFAALARLLLARGHRVVVTGGPGEEALVRRVAVPGTRALSGGLPFGALSALVAEARAVISGDTGPAHLAVAFGTPSVTLFGPVAPALWGPPPDPRHAALWHRGPPGDPHGAAPDPLLLRIRPEEVLAALETV
ncbi:glycosyltransferase family 9 protein [Streptomyces orinoci]|uniref:Glycosyltransferase family 9 protein n=1 Tax=Streptomyces orinoci TaxID=67339 RepID=A0ABV3K0K5_STRON|nr:glycosyltransferase family 9 protein [Streptomyces orinoci]